MAIYKPKPGVINKCVDIFKRTVTNAGIIGAFYLGVTYHEPILRAINSITYEHIPIQPGFFEDPYGLRIETELSKYGRTEVFLVYENKIHIPLTYRAIKILEQSNLERVMNDENGMPKPVVPVPVKR